MPSGNTQHFRALDGWRGICALLVALYHFPGTGTLETLPLVVHADFFVDFFFVLSGFVIAANYLGRMTNLTDAKDFMGLRIARLYPLHLVTFLAFLAFEIVQALAGGFDSAFNGMNDAAAIPTNLLLVQSWNLHNQITWNWPAWSISCEMAAYAAFALLTVAFPRLRWWAYGAALFLSLALLLQLSGGKFLSTWDYGVLRCLAGFFAGVFAFRAWQALSQKAHASRAVWTGLEAAAATLAIAFVWTGAGGLAGFAAPFVFGAAVLVFSFDAGALSRLLQTRAFQWLGLLSYSIYMVHAFLVMRFANVMTAAEKITGQSFTVIDHHGHSVYKVPFVPAELVSLAFLAAVIGVSAITYRWIEVPGRALVRRLLKASAPAHS